VPCELGAVGNKPGGVLDLGRKVPVNPRPLDVLPECVPDRLAVDQRGLPAIADFFDRLLRLRCTGEFAGWGCLVSNAHVEHPPVAIQAILTEHHAALRDAFTSTLKVAQSKKQLRAGVEIDGVAELLTLLAYAVNLRSAPVRPDRNSNRRSALPWQPSDGLATSRRASLDPTNHRRAGSWTTKLLCPCNRYQAPSLVIEEDFYAESGRLHLVATPPARVKAAQVAAPGAPP
jgi:hypothetical protein